MGLGLGQCVSQNERIRASPPSLWNSDYRSIVIDTQINLLYASRIIPWIRLTETNSIRGINLPFLFPLLFVLWDFVRKMRLWWGELNDWGPGRSHEVVECGCFRAFRRGEFSVLRNWGAASEQTQLHLWYEDFLDFWIGFEAFWRILYFGSRFAN